MNDAPTSRSLLRRVGDISPLWLGVGYFVIRFAGDLCILFAARLNAPILSLVGLGLSVAALLVVYIVITWYRDDDALPAGVLLALTILIGGSAAGVLEVGIVERSVFAGFAQLVMSPTRFVVTAIIGIPVGAALVWIARFVTRIIERASGIALDISVSGRPYRSVWERREAKRNKGPQPGSPPSGPPAAV